MDRTKTPKLAEEDKPVRVTVTPSPGTKTEKFQKAKIRKKNNTKKRKTHAPSSSLEVRAEAIHDKYKGLTTPKTPKKNRWSATSKRNLVQLKGRRISKNEAEELDSQQKLEYNKMQKMYREMKKDLRKLKADNKALEIEKRRIKKDQEKLLRDREQFEVETRTHNLRKDNKNTGKKYLVSEETKLRQMLYAERKQWSEERKNLRNEIMRLQGQIGTVRHSGLQRMSVLKRDIMNGFEMALNDEAAKKRESDKKQQKQKDYSRQQREIQRFIRMEKQKALKDLELERKRLDILQVCTY